MILLRRLLSSSRKRKCKGRNEKFSSPGLWNVNQNIRNTLKIKILTIKLYQHCGSIFLRIDSLESYFCSNTLIAHCTTQFGRSKKLSTILNTHVQKFLLSMAWILCVCLFMASMLCGNVGQHGRLQRTSCHFTKGPGSVQLLLKRVQAMHSTLSLSRD